MCQSIRESVSWMLFNTLRYKVRLIVSARRMKWTATHKKKLDALRTEGRPTPRRNPLKQNVVHNFSRYTLSDDEYRVLSYSLDHYVPGRDNGKRTQVEFEKFYQEILDQTGHLAHLTEPEKIELKTKFMDTFSKFSKIKIPDEQRKILEKLYKNPDLVILRQDKGRGVVILDRSIYVDKSETFLNGPEFEKLDDDPTKSFQRQVQETLLSMKKKFSKKLYKKLYPSSSRPGLYYGLAKVHKLKGSNDVNRLPMRPVISNIGTATYELSKHLADLLKPLTKSQYSIDSTKDFVNKIRQKRIPQDFELVSFDVVSLFTSVPLDFTIKLILDKIYKDKLIETKLKRDEMKQLLETCTKEMHFSYNGTIYRQIDGVSMGSPLGPVIANIFMVELEKTLVPQLEENVRLWYRYVDDTFTMIRKGCVEAVLDRLNGFHPSIKFTFEKESNDSIAFLDVKVIKKIDGSFDTDVHRKPTDTNVYVSWEAFAPRAWKTGTLKGLVRRALTICSTEEFQTKEISFLKKVFGEQNGFPSRIIHDCIHSVKRKIEEENSPHEDENVVMHLQQSQQIHNPPESTENMSVVTQVQQSQQSHNSPQSTENPSGNQENENPSNNVVKPIICLPYKGKEGDKIISQFRNAMMKALPPNIKPRFAYQGTKIGTFFKTKDPVPIEHQSDCVYAYKPNGATKYIGETKVRFGTRQYEHGNTDKKSAIYKYKQQNRIEVAMDDFEIIDRGFPNTIKRKLAEALYIKELNPELNEQVKSAKLCLFN